eukprot:529331-Prymnesium_polylepis.1
MIEEETAPIFVCVFAVGPLSSHEEAKRRLGRTGVRTTHIDSIGVGFLSSSNSNAAVHAWQWS